MQKVELLLLFTGDDLTYGYATVGLAERICQEWRPESVDALRILVYGECPVEEIGVLELKMLENGFNIWRKRQTTRERK